MAILYVWIAFTFFVALFTISGKLAIDFIKEYNIGIDYITFVVLLWNFGIVGIISLLWTVPKKLNQAFSISLAILMAITFIQILPEWTGWAILFVISVWDLIAVLCPYGPLRMLVETAQERGDRQIMPGIIYSAMAYYEPTEQETSNEQNQSETIRNDGNDERNANREESNENERSQDEGTPLATDNQSRPDPGQVRVGADGQKETGTSGSAPNNRTTSNETSATITSGTTEATVTTTACSSGPASRQVLQRTNAYPDEDDEEDSGVKLGLGDFIFYSLLVAKAADKADWSVTFACYISILLGLCATLVLLAITKHALPALPISIFLGLVAFFTGEYLVKPFLDEVVLRGIML